MDNDSPPPFFNIPDFLWQRLIDENGFKTLFRLRKVCKPLREYFDDVLKPRLKLEWIKLSLITNGVSIRFGTDVKDARRWDYKREKMGRIIIADGNMDDWNDLADVLKFQKPILKKLILTANFEENLKENAKVLKCFKNALSSLKAPLRVERLEMPAMDQTDVLQILPSIEPSSLKALRINHPKTSESELRIDEIERLPHFQTVKEFSLRSENHNIHPHQFVGIPNVELGMKSISANELIYVLDKLINTPSFVSFCIRYTHFDDTPRLIQLWGAPVEDGDSNRMFLGIERENWFFKDALSNILNVCIDDFYKDIHVRVLTGEEAELNAWKAKNWNDWIGLGDEDTRRAIEAELGIVENVEE